MNPTTHQPADSNGNGVADPTADVTGLARVLDSLAQQRDLLALAVELLKDRERPLPREALDAAELAKVLGIGLRSVRTLDSAGNLPRPVKLGGRVVWSARELRAWLAAGAPSREEWEKLKAERRRARDRRR